MLGPPFVFISVTITPIHNMASPNHIQTRLLQLLLHQLLLLKAFNPPLLQPLYIPRPLCGSVTNKSHHRYHPFVVATARPCAIVTTWPSNHRQSFLLLQLDLQVHRPRLQPYPTCFGSNRLAFLKFTEWSSTRHFLRLADKIIQCHKLLKD